MWSILPINESSVVVKTIKKNVGLNFNYELSNKLMLKMYVPECISFFHSISAINDWRNEWNQRKEWKYIDLMIDWYVLAQICLQVASYFHWCFQWLCVLCILCFSFSLSFSFRFSFSFCLLADKWIIQQGKNGFLLQKIHDFLFRMTLTQSQQRRKLQLRRKE